MIDSQAQVRWLVVVAALFMFVVVPVIAGATFKDTERRTFPVHDVRTENAATIDAELDAIDSKTERGIFLVPSGEDNPACTKDRANCPKFANVMAVPMRRGEIDTDTLLTQVYPQLKMIERPGEPVQLVTVERSFSLKNAAVTGGLLVIGALLVVGAFLVRQPARNGPRQTPPPWPPRPDPVPDPRPRTLASPPSPPQPPQPPLLAPADVPGIGDLVRTHGRSARARSHVDDVGGYVALDDVVVWARPLTPGNTTITAYPDDNVHLTVGARSAPLTSDGGLVP